MLANLGLLYRKAGMSRSAFTERYERGHVPLIEETLGSSFAAYSRCYPVTSDGEDVGFDALTQVWYASASHAERSISLLSDAAIGQRIAEDEKALFDRSRLFFFKADEFVAALPVPGERCIKAVCLSQPLQGDRDAFIQTIERTTLPVIVDLGVNGQPALKACRRCYAIPGSAFQHDLYATRARHPPALITETWFADRTSFDVWRVAYERRRKALPFDLGEPVEVHQFGDLGP
jgi:hypothetical protein